MSSTPNEVLTTLPSLPNLTKLASGKVREIFTLPTDPTSLLFIATDRISAYDVILTNGIPLKGALLTQLSAFWFHLIAQNFPDLRTHLRSTDLPPIVASQTQLLRRTMVVERLQIVKLESIVRGYITGSAWAEYKKSGTVHGMQVQAGLRESERFPRAIWTPSTKAEQGEHDENISREKAVQLVGEDVARRVEEISLKVYRMAHDYAFERGIIIADTKFEFGFDPATNEIVLVDEVLTPDSSRFWPKDSYVVGQSQASYDKQYLRDYLTSNNLKGKPDVTIPDEVVAETARKYREAYEKIVGKEWA